jgi:hypothetical protein
MVIKTEITPAVNKPAGNKLLANGLLKEVIEQVTIELKFG